MSWQPYAKSKAQGPSSWPNACSHSPVSCLPAANFMSWGSDCPLGCKWNLKHFLESALVSNITVFTWMTVPCRNTQGLYLHKRSRGRGARCHYNAAAVGFMGSSCSGEAETGKSLECSGYQHILVGELLVRERSYLKKWGEGKDGEID